MRRVAGNRLLFVYPYDNLDTNPTMVGVVGELLRRGTRIDIATPSGRCLETWSGGGKGNARWIPIPSSVSLRQNRLRPERLVRAWQAGRLVDATIRADNYDLIVGIDPEGVALAGYINRGDRVPTCYLSFELLFEDEVESLYEQKLKVEEREAAQRCSLFLIQDEVRRDAFCLENRIDTALCELVPVAPIDTRPQKSNYLREQLSIPADKTIVLYQGTICGWSQASALEELVSYWNQRYCLVINSRSLMGRRLTSYLDGLSRTCSVYYTRRPVRSADLPLMTASADIGLVSYTASPEHWTSGENLRIIGKSSGKVAYYTMCGLPLLVREFYGLSSIAEGHNFGLSYKRLAESGRVLDSIYSRRTELAAGARRFYESSLEPTRSLNRFCDRLMQITS